MFHAKNFFDLNQTEHQLLFKKSVFVWDILPKIALYLRFRLKPGIFCKVLGKPFISQSVFIGKNTVVEHGATILGPAIIGEGCRIRSGAYIRENVIIGKNVLIGHSSELKNSLIFNNASIPHFNYVGDSIIGYGVHFGAGVIVSNYRLDRKNITVQYNDEFRLTELKKFGAIIGDGSSIGCQTVLNPGSIIGKMSILYPSIFWNGYLDANKIVKHNPYNLQEIIERQFE